MCGSPLLFLPNPHGAVITPWGGKTLMGRYAKMA